MTIEDNEKIARYISHVEDDPMVWQKTSDDLSEMLKDTKEFVGHRNNVNGAGEGVVIDTHTDRIVACFEIPMPDDPIEEKRVVEVVKRWFSGEVCSIEPEDGYQHILTIPADIFPKKITPDAIG